MDESMYARASKELKAGNFAKARELLNALDDDESQLQLAFLLHKGLGGDESRERARGIYSTLAAKGHRQGAYYLATLLLDERKLAEALTNFERSASLGHASGAYWAASLHTGHLGHEKQEERYMFYLTQAASLGHLFAIRDVQVRKMKDAAGLIEWGTAYSRCLAAQVRGAYLAIRNPNDLRLR